MDHRSIVLYYMDHRSIVLYYDGRSVYNIIDYRFGILYCIIKKGLVFQKNKKKVQQKKKNNNLTLFHIIENNCDTAILNLYLRNFVGLQPNDAEYKNLDNNSTCFKRKKIFISTKLSLTSIIILTFVSRPVK